MQMIKRFLLAVFAFAALAGLNPAYAQLRVDITEGHLNPTPVAVVDFNSQNAAAQQVGRDIAGVIRANLDRSGLFRPVDPNAFIERITALEVPPRFADWRVIDAQALVVGEVTPLPDGRIRVVFRFYDVFAEQELPGQEYATTPDNWRRVAHQISDHVAVTFFSCRNEFLFSFLFAHQRCNVFESR